MPRYFVSSDAIAGDTVTIAGRTAHHIATSRRARPGDEIETVDDDGIGYIVKISSASDELVVGEKISSYPAAGEPRLDVAVLQAIAKDGMDEAIDAMVAVGVKTILPISTERTIVALNAERAQRRHEHWCNVARDAAQIAFRAKIPAVHPVASLGDALGALEPDRRVIACAMADGSVPMVDLDFDADTPIAVVIGPEGGLSPTDLAIVRQRGATVAHLGPRVFRARTAASHAVLLCMARLGELSGAPDSHRGRLWGS